MSFSATKFIFNDIPSETFGLICAQMSSGGENTSSAGSSVDIVEEYLYRRSKPYFYGTKFSSKLQFSMSVFRETPISRLELESIEQWLFGHRNYKKLQILQCDMYDVYFNCILNEGNVIAVGNEIFGVQCTVVCDAPWGWGKEIKKTYTTVSSGTIINFVNRSDDNFYLYPTIELHSPTYQTDVIIRNITDNNRESTFTNLKSDETVTIDCELKIVESDRADIINRFDGTYFRLLGGNNRLQVFGNLSEFSIIYTPARKVGS